MDEEVVSVVDSPLLDLRMMLRGSPPDSWAGVPFEEDRDPLVPPAMPENLGRIPPHFADLEAAGLKEVTL